MYQDYARESRVLTVVGWRVVWLAASIITFEEEWGDETVTSSSRFDVVIVGAGPAGCVFANRLTEDSDRTVALLEAGPDYGSDPGAWPDEMRDITEIAPDSHSWGFTHVGRTEDNALALSRARVVGGTSTVNGCIWLRGSAVDYDEWEALGNPGWSFDDLLPYFRRSETDPAGGPMHGSDGPVPISRLPATAQTKVDHAFISAATALGFPESADLNCGRAQIPCVGPPPKNVVDGVRMNAAFTYLAPARSRPNLTIMPDSHVDRVALDGQRAVGVRTVDGRVLEAGEIILCAGAFGSPEILMRSGIGPADHLRELGIPVVAEVSGVGQNLLDHPLVGGLMECAIAPGNEPPSRTFFPILIKARGRRSTSEIDFHVFSGQSFDTVRGAWNLWLSVSLQTSRSRGKVRLTSADPAATLDIDHHYYSEPDDLEIVCDAVELVNQLVRTSPLSKLVEPIPGRAMVWRDRDELRSNVRQNVGTTFHPTGTCRMGPGSDSDSVVDVEGRIHGIAGLRVADASIFPMIPRANIHCTIVAVAEKLADAVRNA
ncbi:MAG: GMC family oxidoreductase [Thermomicrobiales bacterium]